MNDPSALDIIIAIFIGGIGVLIGIFFALRETMCWYFKINDTLKAQGRTNYILERIYSEVSHGKFIEPERKEMLMNPSPTAMGKWQQVLEEGNTNGKRSNTQIYKDSDIQD